jgi:uncharacterized protein (UPF0261 family)
MSLLEGLAATLTDMGFVQLALLFAAVGAYAIAINGSFGAGLRSGAASAAFVSAIAFSTLAPVFMGGVVFLAIAVFSIALFAGSTWVIAAMLGLGGERGPVLVAVEEARAPMRAPALQAVRGLAAGLLRSL